MEGKKVIEKFSQLKVLVVGDLMIDRYLFGKVTRVSPEAPVPVVEWKGEENRLGGAANVALNVDALGAAVFLCGVLGQDQESECFFELMQQKKLDASLLIQLKHRLTTVKTRIIASDQHLLRLDRETTDELGGNDADALILRVEKFLEVNHVDVVIFQDYNKGVFSANVIERLLKVTGSRNIPVTVDPKFNNFWAYKGVQLFKPNLKEVQNALPFPIGTSKTSLDEAAHFIKEKLKVDLVLITLSENGVYVSSKFGSAIYPTTKRKVADVCGAGDAVIAIVSLAQALGLNETDTAWFANLAGGQVVENVGVVPIDLEQLEREMKKGRISSK